MVQLVLVCRVRDGLALTGSVEERPELAKQKSEAKRICKQLDESSQKRLSIADDEHMYQYVPPACRYPATSLPPV